MQLLTEYIWDICPSQFYTQPKQAKEFIEATKADGEDLDFITVAITDKSGIVKVLDNRKITITVSGGGKFI